MTTTLDFRLTGSGWAECDLTVRDTRLTMTVSYTSDALRDLLDATIEMLRNSESATASFDEEPGEYRWCLERISDNKLNIKIRWFDDVASGKPDCEGKLLFDQSCGKRTFGSAIAAACGKLLSEIGIEDYRRKWLRYPFPENEYAKLTEILQQYEFPTNKPMDRSGGSAAS
jgi:hypothetical protein